MSNPFDEPADEDEELSRLVDEELTLGADVLADVDALMQATDLDELMSPADVAVLRGLLKAVQQDTSLHERLDAFIATHCHELVSYSVGEHCEHKLEWVKLSLERPSVTHRHTPGGASPCGDRRHRCRRACRPQTSLHEEYAKIIEASVDEVLSSTGRPAWELFGMLQSALGTDPRARPLVSVDAAQPATLCNPDCNPVCPGCNPKCPGCNPTYHR